MFAGDFTFDPDGEKHKDLEHSKIERRTVVFLGNDDSHDGEPAPALIRKYGFDPTERIQLRLYNDTTEEWESVASTYFYGALIWESKKKVSYLKALMCEKKRPDEWEFSALHLSAENIGTDG